ncbi:MAG: hypothetical protein ACTHVE_11515 [Senegalia sp. (in: firmicutes)]|uniref:hypothetical protein n=1 Tax=Senegalia sp. (in: firmicutes) TaxID=1924098 RepID=UPI003F94FE24
MGVILKVTLSSSDFTKVVKKIGDKVPKDADSKTVSKIVLKVFTEHFNSSKNKKNPN